MNEEVTGADGSAAHVAEELLAAVLAGRPPSAEARVHLQSCAGCREEWGLLTEVQAEVLRQAVTMPVAPPPSLRAALLQRAGEEVWAESRSPVPPLTAELAVAGPTSDALNSVRPLRAPTRLAPLRWVLGAAAVLAALTFGSLLLAPPGLAHALPDPAVVVNVGGPLLVASNGNTGQAAGTQAAGQRSGDLQRAQITLISGDRVSATLQVDSPHPAWFTEGVRLGGQVYLADAANDRVLEVQVRPLRLVRSYPVPGGVAGLSAGGDRVYYKSVSGRVGLLPGAGTPGRSASLAEDGALPMPEVMDAVLLQGGTLYVTHHRRGELCLLDPQTLQVRRRIRVGGAPVGLAGLNGDLLVLDVAGRLLRLNAAGATLQVWSLPGHPDKLVLNGGQAVVTDRAGGVTQLDLKTGRQMSATLIHPMDLTLTEDGHLAVAQGATGVALLGQDLKPMPGGDIR